MESVRANKSLPTPQAVIFDWDDTLVETWPVVLAAVNVTLVAMGAAPWSETEARAKIGPPARVLFTGLFGEDRWQEADALYIAAYKSNIAGHLRVHDGAEDTLKALQAAKIPMVVVSSKRGAILRQESTHLGFDGYFASLVGAGDAAQDKPALESVQLALQPLNIKPGPDVWFIGDSGTDLVCAYNADCTPILIETKSPSAAVLAAHPPAASVRSHLELLNIIENKNLVGAIKRDCSKIIAP